MRNKFFVFGAYEGLRTIQGQPFLGSVPSQAFLSGNFSALATPIRDPLTGQPFPGNIIPQNRFSKFANTLTPTIPAPNTAGREQLHGHQELRRRREYRDRARGPDAQQQPQLVPAVHVLQRIAAAARNVQRNRPAPERAEPRRRTHVGALVLVGQRIPLRVQLRVPPERANQPRRSQLDGRSGSTEPLGCNVSARVRTPERRDGWLLGARRRRQHAGRDGKHLQRVERDQQDVRRPHAPVRRAGTVPQVRAPHRQLDARQLHVQRHLHGQFRRRLPARLLLDLRRGVRRLRSDVQLTDHRAVHRRQLAGERQAEPPARIAVGIPGAVGRTERRGSGVRCRDRQDRVQRVADLDARRARAAGAPAGGLFSGRHPAEGLQQLWTSRRGRVQPDRPDGRALRVRCLLRQPQPERAAVHAPDSAVLRAVLAEPARRRLRCRSTRSFPI